MSDPHRPAPAQPGNGHAQAPQMPQMPQMPHPAAPRPLQAPRPAGAPMAQPAPAAGQSLRPPPMAPAGGQSLRPPAAHPAGPSLRPTAAPAGMPKPAGAPPSMPVPAQDDDAIALIEDAEDDGSEPMMAAPAVSKINFGAEHAHRTVKWNRQPTTTGKGAVRVRTFHAKLSDQGLEYLDEAINHWLDEHPEVDVKHITTTTGMFDGKFKDLALIVNVWY